MMVGYIPSIHCELHKLSMVLGGLIVYEYQTILNHPEIINRYITGI